MKQMSASEVSNSIAATGIDARFHQGDYTRKSATQIAATGLLRRGLVPTVEAIDDLCFMTWGFPISHRKGSPLKTKGGMKVIKRITNYIDDNPSLSFDGETVSAMGKFADSVEAAVTLKVRKADARKASEIKRVKTIVRKKAAAKGLATRKKNAAKKATKNKGVEALKQALIESK